jgi:hypothetical protein
MLNINKKKGLAVLLSFTSLFSFNLAPALAQDSVNVRTSLVIDDHSPSNDCREGDCRREVEQRKDATPRCEENRNAEGCRSDVVIKAKWEMETDNRDRVDSDDTGKDDSRAAGAQFDPELLATHIAFCAIVSDPDDVNRVQAEVFNPGTYRQEDREERNASNEDCRPGRQRLIVNLDQRLSPEAGQRLFCDQIRHNNNNLPTFNRGFDYNEVCRELEHRSAAVYCGVLNLAATDRAGNYRVAVRASSNDHRSNSTLENTFRYNSWSAFQSDFSRIDYGRIALDRDYTIDGDDSWDNLDRGKATIRNLGNTPLNIRIRQDDMGLGKDNIRFRSRLGGSGSFTDYRPEATATLARALDRGDSERMDFGIRVSGLPHSRSDCYTGNLTLSGQSLDQS